MNLPTASRRSHNVSSSAQRRACIDALEGRTYFTALFSAPANFSGVASITAIASADLNGDGATDVMVEGQRQGVPVVGVYLAKNGTFDKPTIYPFVGSPAGIAVGDFLGNGKRDIAVVNSAGDQLIVFLNDGQGNFSAGVGANLGGSSGDTALAAADFNGDGKADIAAVDPVDNAVDTLFSTGNQGLFATEGTITVPSPVGIVTGDLNGDGHPDLAILSSNGSVYVALNTGAGAFAAAVPYSLGSAGAVPTSITLGDFNGDSRPDLAVAASPSAGAAGSALVMLNHGDGTFAAASAVASLPANPVSILTGNFEPSSHGDLAVIDQAGGLTVIPGNGDGTFGAAQTVFTNQLASPGPGAVAADFNNDGLTDIAYLDSGNGGFSESLNISSGMVTPPPPTTSPLAPSLLSPVPTATLVSGQKVKTIRQAVRLTNSGSSTLSGAVSVSLTLSTSASGTSNDVAVGMISRNVKLKMGKSVTLPVLIKSIPANLQGAYYLRATVTDPSLKVNAVASAATVNIRPPVIDLTGAFIALATSAKSGKKLPMTFSVTNLGNVPATGPLTVDVSLSDTTLIDSTTVTFDDLTRPHVNIKPGGVLRIHLSAAIPANTPANAYVIVQIDPTHVYGNMSNNTFASDHAVIVQA